MSQLPIQYILFDASGTLIHKPSLWQKIKTVLTKNGFDVPLDELQKKHKLLSECIHFPDRTSKAFYQDFNAEVLFALGILPTTALLDELFEACTYLAWEKFEDTNILQEFDLPIGILSNFNASLKDKLDGFFGDIFSDVLISEVLGVAKPKVEFYQKAVEIIGLPAEQILYVGDSLKLDIKPALEVGMRPYLIDRNRYFPSSPYQLDSLHHLKQLLS